MSIISIPYTRGQAIEAELLDGFIDGAALVRITIAKQLKTKVRRVEQDYWLEKRPSDFGACFRLTKLVPPEWADEDSVYDVLIDNDQDCYCNCHGFESHGYCKHILAIKALRNQGEI